MSFGPRSSLLQYHDQIPTSPTHLQHASSHSRSLRDLNNNNDDHHYPISVGNLVLSGLNRMPYWSIECLESVFVVTGSPAVPIPSTMTLFLTSGVSPGHSLSDWSVALIPIVVRSWRGEDDKGRDGVDGRRLLECGRAIFVNETNTSARVLEYGTSENWKK